MYEEKKAQDEMERRAIKVELVAEITHKREREAAEGEDGDYEIQTVELGRGKRMKVRMKVAARRQLSDG